MKRSVLFLCVLMAGSLFVPDLASAYPGCQRKEQILERKLAIAKARGNMNQAASLEIALSKVRLYCTDGSLRAKAEMNLADKREEVLEREEELEEARAKGDPKKIAKRERKLREARREMEQAERELGAQLGG